MKSKNYPNRSFCLKCNLTKLRFDLIRKVISPKDTSFYIWIIHKYNGKYRTVINSNQNIYTSYQKLIQINSTFKFLSKYFKFQMYQRKISDYKT